jgi:hypothetical protein
MPPSTRNLLELPSLYGLLRLTKSLAMLDAIMEPRWEYRYCLFNSKWGAGEQMAKVDNGSGDELFCLFSSVGAAIKGFSHESEMSPWVNDNHKIWPGVLDSVPATFASFLREPAFTMADTTFCIWRTIRDAQWNIGTIEFPEGDDPDGSEDLLELYDGKPESYVGFAEDYYEKKLSIGAVRAIYDHEPLSTDLIQRLNAEVNLESLAKDIDEIGYPEKTNSPLAP